MGFLSYDSNGNKYEIAPIKKYNNQNPLTSNVPLKEIWYGGGRVLLNTQTGYSLIYDIELNPFMIRKITSPLATSEQFDILPLSDCLLDSGGNCNAMPNEIPALQTLNLNDRNVIDRQGNIVFQIPLSDYDNSLAPTLTTWYSNGDAFVTFGNKTNRTVYITQDAGGSWDVCKLSEFTLTIV